MFSCFHPASLRTGLARLSDIAWMWAQEGAGAGAGDAPLGPGDAEPTMLQQILGSPFLLGGGLLALFYVMVLLPEKRRKQEAAKKLEQLKKNQRVVTIGGIHGVIVSAPADADTVVIRTDESSGQRLKINRSAISTVVDDEKEKKDKSSEKSS